ASQAGNHSCRWPGPDRRRDGSTSPYAGQRGIVRSGEPDLELYRQYGQPTAGHTATLLSNGMVLVTGGGTYPPFATAAELYDPATGTWMITGSPIAPHRVDATATLLPNGKVLVAGGSDGNDELSSAELYDPATGTWTATGSLAEARSLHAATLLANGQALAVGGFGTEGVSLASAELYQPVIGT